MGDIAVDPKNSNMLYLATVDYFRLAGDRGALGDFGIYKSTDAVSYTHLTLPTIYSV